MRCVSDLSYVASHHDSVVIVIFGLESLDTRQAEC